MSNLYLFLAILLGIALSPVGWIAVYVITGTHWGAVLFGIGLCLIAADEDVGEDV